MVRVALTAVALVGIVSCSQPDTEVDSAGGTTTTQPEQTGSITVHVWHGLHDQVPIGGLTVRAQRLAPCDPDAGSLPQTAEIADTFEAVTGVEGNIAFTDIPLGCYTVSADPLEDFLPANALGDGLFLTSSQPDAEAGLEYYQPAPECGSDVFEALPYFADGAEVQYCRDGWAVVNANSPGDTTHLLQWRDTAWASYAAFPTRQCRSKASSDGVPAPYVQNFDETC